MFLKKSNSNCRNKKRNIKVKNSLIGLNSTLERLEKQQRTWRWMNKNFSRTDRKILGKPNPVSVTHEHMEQYQVIYHIHYLNLLRRRERKWGRKNIWISKNIWKFPMCGEKNQPTDPKSWAKLKKEI